MCGITGFIKQTRSISEDTHILSEMLNTLEHRGPDDYGANLFQDGNYTIALGHRRLSILDVTSNGHQPMFFEELVIIFNGEIYNFKEIRSQLINIGYFFLTESDTEVILKAYHAYGDKVFELFNGMWAIVIYNRKSGEITISRDRSGVKPLYWYFADDIFLFSSELKAFHQNPSFKKEIDNIGLSYYFQYGYIKEPFTIFKNCRKLEAGHVLKIKIESTIQIKKAKYWDINDSYLKPKLKMDSNTALEEVERLMIKGFNYRMVSDVPVGVFLSGGIDSSLVAGILQKTSSRKIKTFTIGFENEKFDEAPFAKKIAKHLDTDHHEYYCGNSDVIDMVGLLPEIMDEPFADSSIIPTLLVSKFASKEVTVALSADGGDELFGGYTSYLDSINLTKKFSKYPFLMKDVLNPLLNKLPFKKVGLGKFDVKYNKLLEFSMHPNSVLKNYEVFNKRLFDSEIKDIFNFNVQSLFDEINGDIYNSSLDEMLAASYKTYMNNDVLYKMDKATMAFSLEGREPFLDHNLVDFVAQLPDKIKINDGVLKWGAKEILYKYIPKELYHGKKMGFSIPQELLVKEVYSMLNENTDIIADLGIKCNELNVKNTEWRLAWSLYIYVIWFVKWMK
jgi:asparagine synthase (glutamine-hydrolysing)